MISIGIDASKRKSTLCILKVEHTKKSLNALVINIQELEEQRCPFIIKFYSQILFIFLLTFLSRIDNEPKKQGTLYVFPAISIIIS